MLPKLYFISSPYKDKSIASISKALAMGIKFVQLRLKEVTQEEYFLCAKEAKRLCDDYGANLVINDNIEIAECVNAFAVHLGQEDIKKLSKQDTKKLSNLRLGITVRNYDQMKSCLKYNPLYYGYGAYRNSKTKSSVTCIKSEEFTASYVLRLINKIPTFVIGGVEVDDIKTILNKGYKGVAFFSLLDKFEPNNNVLEEWIV